MKKIKDWSAIKKEYLSGKNALSKIAKKYDVSIPTIKKYAEKEDWGSRKKVPKGKNKSGKSSAKSKTKSEKKEKDLIKKTVDKNQKNKEAVDYNKKHLKMYEDCAHIISALTKLYLESNIEPDVGALQKIVASIEKIQKGQRVSLGLDKENNDIQLPKINIVENLSKDKI